MRRHTLWMSVFLLLALSVAWAQRAMRVVGKDGVLPDAPYRTSWALLIGINTYPNLPIQYRLNYAVDDVRDLKQMLVEQHQFPESKIITLTNENATRQRITDAMAQLADSSKVDKKDRVLVYFSGHGQTVHLPRGGEIGFILPYDAKVDMGDLTNISAYYRTCLDMGELKRLSRMIPAKHVLFLIDSCYSGLAVSSRGGLKPSLPGYLRKVASLPVQQLITAGLKGDESYEKPEWGHGAFTYKLLEALRTGVADENDDGVITCLELAGHLRNVVPNISPNQTPQYGYFEGEGEFLFLREVPIQPSKPPARITGKEGTPMVLIPAGEFQMGRNDGESDEKPMHTVYLDAFYMDVYAVSNAQYKKFMDAAGYPAAPVYWDDTNFNAPNQPVVGVDWYDAKAYCEWAGKRLPTEAEWEKAAHGGLVGKLYPWGNKPPNGTQCNFADKNTDFDFSDRNIDDGYKYTAPVDSYFPNGYGLYNMVGNVWEWCADWYDENYYANSPKRNPTGPTSGETRVVRGGAWNWNISTMRIASRTPNQPTYTYNNTGFRCAEDVTP